MSKYRGSKEAKQIRQQQALELRIAGARYRQIGAQLGTSHVQAFRDVQAALVEVAKDTHEQAEKLRDIELERCEKMTLALWPKVRSGDERAIRANVAVMERRARLLGLDAAQQIGLSGSIDFNPYTSMNQEQMAASAAALAQKVAAKR